MEGQSSVRKQAKFSQRILCSSQRFLQSSMPNEYPVIWVFFCSLPSKGFGRRLRALTAAESSFINCDRSNVLRWNWPKFVSSESNWKKTCIRYTFKDDEAISAMWHGVPKRFQWKLQYAFGEYLIKYLICLPSFPSSLPYQVSTHCT